MYSTLLRDDEAGLIEPIESTKALIETKSISKH